MNELCFNIRNNNLFMDKVLIDYNDDPVFYVCVDESENYYLVLCINMTDVSYYISRINLHILLNMLCGQYSMRDAFLSGDTFWNVTAGEDIVDDKIKELSRNELKTSDLPKEKAVYKICSSDVEEYKNTLLSKMSSIIKLDDVVFQSLNFKRLGTRNNNILNYSMEEKFSGGFDDGFHMDLKLIGIKKDEYKTTIEVTGMFSPVVKVGSLGSFSVYKHTALSLLTPYVRDKLISLVPNYDINPDISRLSLENVLYEEEAK